MHHPIHIVQTPTAMLPEYLYDAYGYGVRADLVREVLNGWAYISSTEVSPEEPLQNVNQSAITEVDNIARIAAKAVLRKLAEELPVLASAYTDHPEWGMPEPPEAVDES